MASVLLVVPAPAAGQTSPPPRPRPYADSYANSWAVIIGIDTYQKAPRLNYATADAKAVAALLPSLGFPNGNIQLLLDANATKARIEAAFYQRLNGIGPNDRLFVYFSGHGKTQPTRTGEEGYILPVDADPDNLPLTAIAMDDIQRIAKRLPAKHYLFVMDACFSGFALTRAATDKDMPSQDVAAWIREPVVQVITAGGKGQVSIEEGGHGLFTRRLLDGLRGLADVERRGFVSAGQLAAWVESGVSRDSKGKMTPQYSKLDGEGHFVFFLATPSRALTPAADLSGTFVGQVQGIIASRRYTQEVTATFVQRGKNLSGTWTSGGAGGGLTGEIDGTVVRAFRVSQASPCPATFHGRATLSSDNNSLAGSYAGTDCNGPVTAEFRISRTTVDEKFGDKPLEPPDLLNIGLSYLNQQRYDEALDYFEQLLRAAEKRGDESLEAQALGLMGTTLGGQGRFADALRHLEGSLTLYEKLGDERLQSLVLFQLGLTHVALDRPAEAQPFYERSLSFSEQLGDEPQMARTLYYLGLLAAQQGRYTDAVGFFDRALPLATRHNLPERARIAEGRDQALAKAATLDPWRGGRPCTK
jgi:tetratricopeptide (TPR) repeat protein